MATGPKRLYWDACAWIAMIQDEKIPLKGGGTEYRGQMCRQVVGAARRGLVELVTSSLSLVEVCKRPEVGAENDDQKLRDYFENPYILLVNLDRQVGDLARRLMLAGYAGLKPLDATHVASAVVGRAGEMHTFDGKLLAMDGLVKGLDGSPLRICKPEVPAPPAPLLEEAKRGGDPPGDRSRDP